MFKMNKNRIGILLDSKNINIYLKETLNDLQKLNNIDIYFLINKGCNSSVQTSLLKKTFIYLKNDFWRAISKIIFFIVVKIEEWIISKKIDLSKQNESFFINDGSIKEISIFPIFSKKGMLVKYSNIDIVKIKNLQLDLIIRGNASGIFKGDILNVSKLGILSFHHGDNRWNRGAPPAFWEVYLRKSKTGFIIQLLTEELDGGKICFRGNVPTQRSYTENKAMLYNESNKYLYLTAVKLINHKCDIEINAPYSGVIFRTPNAFIALKYLAVTIKLFGTLVFNRVVLKRHQRWNVSFIPGNWEGAKLNKCITIKNPQNRFFADPFVIKHNGKHIVYVEDYYYKYNSGRISAIELVDEDYTILGNVIHENFHMSFPFVFTYQKELYMIPETCNDRSIRIYKCTKFPMEWKFMHKLIDDINAADTMVFEINKKWAMLTNISSVPKGGSHSASLHVFFAENPLSRDWKAHKNNPLIFNPLNARNGGILQRDNGELIRVRQKQGFYKYGEGVSFAVINQICEDFFSETEIAEINSGDFNNAIGMHHFHSSNHYTVFDHCKNEQLR